MHLPDNTLLRGNTYRIIHFISSGGFGCTYEAEHILFRKRLAIKEFFVKDFCNRDGDTHHVTVATQSKAELVEKLRQKFIDEAIAINQLQHPHIVNVSDVFEENGTAYYVMDFIDGQSLGAMVKQRGPLPEAQALKYIRQVADALRYVHSQNRLHLDLKPGNIMIDAQDNAILIDFGASKHYDEASGEQTSTLLGVNTPGYAPAEQMSRTFKTFSPSADIYALGATLYKALSGVTPPDAIDLMTGNKELPPLPAAISPATRQAVAQAMLSRSKDRPQSVDEFLAQLDAKPKAEEEEVEATVYERPDLQSEPAILSGPAPILQAKPRNKKELFVGLILFAAVVSVVFLLTFQDNTTAPVDSVIDTITATDSITQTIEESTSPDNEIAHPEPIVTIPEKSAKEEPVAPVKEELIEPAQDQQQITPIPESAQSIKEEPLPQRPEEWYTRGESYYKQESYSEAITCYEKAADQGYAKAQYTLGWMYDHGRGVTQNYTKAEKLYRSAAEQGLPKAQNKLAGMYFGGRGVQLDYAEAMKWFKKAADQGEEEAQYLLGYMYEKGYGVEKNYTEAAKWYRKADAQGYSYASLALKRLNK